MNIDIDRIWAGWMNRLASLQFSWSVSSLIGLIVWLAGIAWYWVSSLTLAGWWADWLIILIGLLWLVDNSGLGCLNICWYWILIDWHIDWDIWAGLDIWADWAFWLGWLIGVLNIGLFHWLILIIDCWLGWLMMPPLALIGWLGFWLTSAWLIGPLCWLISLLLILIGLTLGHADWLMGGWDWLAGFNIGKGWTFLGWGWIFSDWDCHWMGLPRYWLLILASHWIGLNGIGWAGLWLNTDTDWLLIDNGAVIGRLVIEYLGWILAGTLNSWQYWLAFLIECMGFLAVISLIFHWIEFIGWYWYWYYYWLADGCWHYFEGIAEYCWYYWLALAD